MFSYTIRRIAQFVDFDSHLREVIENTGIAFVLMVGGLGLGFAVNVVLARLLGAEGVGIYYLAFDLSNTAITLATFGLSKAALRFIAAHASLGEWTKVRGVYRKSTTFAACLSVSATAALMILAPWLAHNVYSEPRLALPLRVMSLTILPTSILYIHSEALRGLKRIRDSVFLSSVGISALSLPLLFFFVNWAGILGAVSTRLTTTVIVLFVSIVLWRSATPHLKKFSANFSSKRLYETSLPFFSVDLTNLVMRRADTMLLGVWATSEAVGIYNVAVRVAVLTSVMLGALNSIIAPKFAALAAQEDMEALGQVAKGATRIMVLIATTISVPLFLFPAFILQLFGTEFSIGATALRILIIGQFVNVAAGPVGFLLLMSGHEKVQRNNVVISAVFNILLNILLIPSYGIIGAATASSISLAAKNLLSVHLVRKHLQIKVW